MKTNLETLNLEQISPLGCGWKFHLSFFITGVIGCQQLLQQLTSCKQPEVVSTTNEQLLTAAQPSQSWLGLAEKI